MQIRGTGLAHVGQKRSTNEDCWLADDRLGLYIVADGMGGARAGEVASATVVETVAHTLRNATDQLETARAESNPQVLEALIRQAVQAACQEVFRLSTERPERSGMGCTLTVLLVCDGFGIMGHVGDSRLYLARDQKVHQLSQDHTVIAEMIRQGVLTEERAKNSRFKSVLSRAIGTQPAVQVDILSFDVLPEDRFLLCSDGFANYLPHLDWLSHELAREDPEAVVGELVRFANDAGGADSITVLLVEVEDVNEDTHSTQERVLLMTVLESHPLFEGLTLYQQAAVLRHCEVRDVAANDIFVNEGDPFEGLALVIRGALISASSDPDDVWGPFDAIGLSSLLMTQRAVATMSAKTATRVLLLPQAHFSILTRMRPALGVTLLKRLAMHYAEVAADA